MWKKLQNENSKLQNQQLKEEGVGKTVFKGLIYGNPNNVKSAFKTTLKISLDTNLRNYNPLTFDKDFKILFFNKKFKSKF